MGCTLQFAPSILFQVSWQFASTQLYSLEARLTGRHKCLAQENNTMTQTWLKVGPLDLQLSALTL